MLAAGAQACLSLAEVGDGKLGSSVSEERLQDCVNVILSYQNSDGGWATYENTRSYSALEAGPSLLLLHEYHISYTMRSAGPQDCRKAERDARCRKGNEFNAYTSCLS